MSSKSALAKALARRLTDAQLPGDAPIGGKALDEAATFVIAAAARRGSGESVIGIESVSGAAGERLGLIGHLHAICAIWVIACIGTQLLPLVGIEVFWRVQKYGLLIYGHFLIAGIMFYQMWQGRRSAVALLVIFLCLVSVALANTAVTSVVYALFFAMAWLAITSERLAKSCPVTRS